MIYVAAGVAALGLIGGLLYLVGRGAERRERQGRHRRGLRAGAGVESGGEVYDPTRGHSYHDGGGSDSGGGGGD